MPLFNVRVDRQEMPVGRDFEVHHKNNPLPVVTYFHSHDYFEFYFFLSGNMRLIMESHTFPLIPHTMIIIPPGHMHMASIIGQAVYYERFFLYVTRDSLRKISTSDLDLSAWVDSMITQERYCFCLNPDTFGTCLRIADEMIHSTGDDCPAARHINRCRVSTLMGTLAQFTLAEQAQPTMPSTTHVGKLIDYINQHLAERLTLDELAEQFYISKYYMLHAFKQHTNTSIYSYIQIKRIINAKVLMQSGTSPGEACHLSGFGDYAGFYKTFLRNTGVSPRDYVNRLKQKT